MNKFIRETARQPSKRILVALLAAGESRRFNGIKLQATVDVIDSNGKIKSQPLLLQTLDKLTSLNTKTSTGLKVELLVVLGAHQEKLDNLLSSDVNRRFNPNWKSGIASSIKEAVIEAEALQVDGLLIALADHIGVTLDDYQQLITAWQSYGQTCCAQYQNSFGVPAVFNSSDFTNLASLTGDTGAKHLLKKKSNLDALSVVEIEGVAIDIDRRADIEKWQKMIVENLS
ncbi:NTP transferase domain-containing protein [Microbulbifer sp. EKSA008]|uniref:nucleotidyltransferase family protein n=1 Tax=unclassified Microbulbifer TaxID=2619833 RepID=UPI0040391D23